MKKMMLILMMTLVTLSSCSAFGANREQVAAPQVVEDSIPQCSEPLWETKYPEPIPDTPEPQMLPATPEPQPYSSYSIEVRVWNPFLMAIMAIIVLDIIQRLINIFKCLLDNK